MAREPHFPLVLTCAHADPPFTQARKGNRTLSFYTLPEYEAWRESLANTRDAGGWEIKYYKGLGTSSAKEAKEYFANMEQHKKDFAWEGEWQLQQECVAASQPYQGADAPRSDAFALCPLNQCMSCIACCTTQR